MSIEPGRSLLHYRIVEKLGEGGMGVVWRATDTTLDREVAIKVLPDTFAGDTERLARFEREAQVLASLNHPRIASIYGLEHTDEQQFLVLELVEGPTLSERIAAGAARGLRVRANRGGRRSARGPCLRARSAGRAPRSAPP